MSNELDAAALADDLVAALDVYAALLKRARGIASNGAGAEEIAEWSATCFDEAVSLRLLEADSIGFAQGVPENAGVLVRELYESLVILSGIERPAHVLSMPVSTCANGTSLGTLLREKGELARWFSKVSGRPLEPVEMPDSLLPGDPGMSAALGFASGGRWAANSDHDQIEEERSRDLNDVFAGRLSEGIRLYEDALASLGEPSSTAEARMAWAREEAPALLGFARLADRRTIGLDPPAAAAPAARLIADGFVTLAAAENAEDLATLPYPDADEVEDAMRPLRSWLGRLGTV